MSGDESVNHPSHYGGDTDYEVIKVLEAWDLELAKGFCWGNLIKYTARAGQKDSEVEDRKKAAWYADRLVQIEEKLAARSPRPRSAVVGAYSVGAGGGGGQFSYIEPGGAGGGSGRSSGSASGGAGGSSAVRYVTDHSDKECAEFCPDIRHHGTLAPETRE